MNNVDLMLLEKQKIDKLKKNGLDPDGINEFKSKIKKVSKKEKEALGKELFDLLMSNSYNDSTDWEKIVELIYKGANIEYKDDKKGDFALLRCARKGYLKAFLALISAGANVNQKNNYLTTTTMASARHGNKEILEILILMNADINAKCKDGDNAIISARKHNRVECFNMLVNAGANLCVVSQEGKSIYSFGSNPKFESPLIETASKREIISNRFDTDINDIFEEAKKDMEKILKK